MVAQDDVNSISSALAELEAREVAPRVQSGDAAGSSKDSTLPDGRQLAPVCTLSGHTGAVYSLSFAPNGVLLASGSFDKSVRCWSIDSHEPTEVRNRAAAHSLGVTPKVAVLCTCLPAKPNHPRLSLPEAHAPSTHSANFDLAAGRPCAYRSTRTTSPRLAGQRIHARCSRAPLTTPSACGICSLQSRSAAGKWRGLPSCRALPTTQREHQLHPLATTLMHVPARLERHL